MAIAAGRSCRSSASGFRSASSSFACPSLIFPASLATSFFQASWLRCQAACASGSASCGATGSSASTDFIWLVRASSSSAKARISASIADSFTSIASVVALSGVPGVRGVWATAVGPPTVIAARRADARLNERARLGFGMVPPEPG
ncbi:MAG: hypothetical protein R2909_13060 [Gemmatimonadales bacterium]